MPFPATVAVLDDEPQMRKALRRLLGCHGFRVEDYEDGAAFLALAQDHPVDCLVLDLHMPEVSGFDVLTALSGRHPGTPIVVITGHDEPDTRERTRALGAAAYLRKPFDEATLVRAIEAAISSRAPEE